MNTNNNSQITAELRDVFKLQVNDNYPNVSPIVDVTPKKVKNGFTTSGILINNTSQALVIPTDKVVYITSAEIKWIKDASSTSVSGALVFISETGATNYLIRAAFLTLTAETGSASIVFPHPIKVQKGGALQITSSTNVANISIGAVVSYFTDDIDLA